MDSKEFYNEVYNDNHKDNYGGDLAQGDWKSRVQNLRCNTQSWLDHTGLSKKSTAKILEVGCGMGYVSDIHPNYTGIEYSKTAVEKFKKIHGNFPVVIEGDAQQLPFEDSTFDGVFTWAVLEHVSNPSKAMLEIDRVLKPGGYALIAPAWHCRPYTVKKLQQRKYVNLSFLEKLEKFSIPIKENIIFRSLINLPFRLFREFRFFFLKLGGSKSSFNLKFQKLYPQWDLINKYGHVSDDDALASIDMHSAFFFFLTRGYDILSHRNLWQRLLSRGGGISLKKLDD